MDFTSCFNCKQTEKQDFSHYLVFDRIRALKIRNGESGIRMFSMDFLQMVSRHGWVRLFRAQD